MKSDETLVDGIEGSMRQEHFCPTLLNSTQTVFFILRNLSYYFPHIHNHSLTQQQSLLPFPLLLPFFVSPLKLSLFSTVTPLHEKQIPTSPYCQAQLSTKVILYYYTCDVPFVLFGL